MTGSFEKECLKRHNEYRRKHGCPDLILKPELCELAKQCAEKQSDTDDIDHCNKLKYGENLYTKWSASADEVQAGLDAVDAWYHEIEDYTFGQEPKTLKAGHFTQLIWKESKHFGCGFSKSKSGKMYIVGTYEPAGNADGQFTENVPPPRKFRFCPWCCMCCVNGSLTK